MFKALIIIELAFKNYGAYLRICNAFGITLSQFFAEAEEPLVVSPEQKELWDSFSALPPNVQEDIRNLISNILANQ